MKEFSGYEYLQMDVASNNPFSGDKLTFEERIAFTEANDANLENVLLEKGAWKERPLYLKAVQALRKAQQGKPTGHMVGSDAVCSGMQIMSVMTGCYAGAKATGLVDPSRRPDAYTDITNEMGNLLGQQMHHSRQEVKDSVMKGLYGSKAEPKKIFGEDTVELAKFYVALQTVAPGAWRLVDALLDSWNDWSLTQEWLLPDGGHVRNRVMQSVKKRIEVNELNHTTFTYQYKENEGEKNGLKNIANAIHSVDAWILRSVIRRCSYDAERTPEISNVITEELLERTNRNMPDYDPEAWSEDLTYYMEQYNRSGIVDVVILPWLSANNIRLLPTDYLKNLNTILQGMLEHKPFPIITIHDEYKCHPNNMNHLRRHYRDVLAELADANLMEDILSQLLGIKGTFTKLSDDLGTYIRQSNYSLC